MGLAVWCVGFGFWPLRAAEVLFRPQLLTSWATAADAKVGFEEFTNATPPKIRMYLNKTTDTLYTNHWEIIETNDNNGCDDFFNNCWGAGTNVMTFDCSYSVHESITTDALSGQQTNTYSGSETNLSTSLDLRLWSIRQYCGGSAYYETRDRSTNEYRYAVTVQQIGDDWYWVGTDNSYSEEHYQRYWDCGPPPCEFLDTNIIGNIPGTITNGLAMWEVSGTEALEPTLRIVSLDSEQPGEGESQPTVWSWNSPPRSYWIALPAGLRTGPTTTSTHRRWRGLASTVPSAAGPNSGRSTRSDFRPSRDAITR